LISVIASHNFQNQPSIGFTRFYLTEKTGVFYCSYQTPLSNRPNWRIESMTDTHQSLSWSMNDAESAVVDSDALPEWIDSEWQELWRNH
jgi:hypothetical protein